MTRQLALVALAVASLASARARAEPAADGTRVRASPVLATAPPAPPADDPKPRSGLGAMIVGFAGLAIGTINAVFLPVCEPLYRSDFFAEDGSADDRVRVCRITSAVFAAEGYIAGAIGLGIGLPRWRRYQAWKRRHGHALLSEWSIALAPLPGGGAGRWVGRF